MITIQDAKTLARELSRGSGLTHSQVLEAVAHAGGCRDWNTFVATAPSSGTAVRAPGAPAGDEASSSAPGAAGTSPDAVSRQQVVPILRVFDHALAREFYGEFLGFTWVWQQQHEPDLPVYAQVERAGSVLHLSEHHGDATPGGAVMIVVDDLAGYHAQLLAARHRNARPAMEDNPWGSTMTVADPFGNRLVFWQRSTG